MATLYVGFENFKYILNLKNMALKMKNVTQI